MKSALEKIELTKGDICQIPVDAIVNAANSNLCGGGGVDGAIHRAGGPSILEECRQILNNSGRCESGNAVITGAGNLPAKFVIHTVGPVWNGGYNNEAQKLASCYVSSLALAELNGCKSLSFPNISTGVYGYPREKAAPIALDSVLDYLCEHDFLEKVIFVCFDNENFLLMKNLLDGKGYLKELKD